LNTATGVTYLACGANGVLAINGQSVITVITAGQCPTPISIVTTNTGSGVVYVACFGGGVVQLMGTAVTIVATAAQCPNPMQVRRRTQEGTHDVNHDIMQKE
jgi:hypothetical protein